MSTRSPNPILENALTKLPDNFRTRLIDSYLDLKKGFAENRHDTAGLAAGRLCEVVIRFLQQRIFGTSTPFGSAISNFADECRKMITAPKTAGNESERVVLPRALVFLYTMRNKRGIGHAAGDVDANSIDMATMARVADWIVCELIRINHAISLEEAQDIIDGISVRQLPAIWEVAGKKRVLTDGLKARDQALLLLYSTQDSAVLIEDLYSWIEYSNFAVFKNKVIRALHQDRLLEFDEDSDAVTLSPKGAAYVEEKLLNQ